jgi:hypothetical protein
MQRVRITIIWPMASRISGAVSLNTLARFAGVMKAGNRDAISAEQQDDRAGQQHLARHQELFRIGALPQIPAA